MKNFIKGATAAWFVSGIPLLVIGAILYAWSEKLGGIENVQRGKNLELWGGIVFFAGVFCWVMMFVADGRRRNSK